MGILFFEFFIGLCFISICLVLLFNNRKRSTPKGPSQDIVSLPRIFDFCFSFLVFRFFVFCLTQCRCYPNHLQTAHKEDYTSYVKYIIKN
jgi:hypothetical protein